MKNVCTVGFVRNANTVSGVLLVIRSTMIATLMKNPKAIQERSTTKNVFILPPILQSERNAINPIIPQMIALTINESQEVASQNTAPATSKAMNIFRNVFQNGASSSFLSAKKTKKALNIPITKRPRKSTNIHSFNIKILYGARIPSSVNSFW